MSPEKKTVSHRQQAYIRGLERHARRVTLWQWGLLIGLIVIWEIAAQTKLIDAFLLSSPSRILDTVLSLIKRGELWQHIGVTVFETLCGFALGGLLGGVLAIALWWSPSLHEVLDPYLVILNALPKIALGPIFIVWLGAGIKSIIAITVLVTVIVTLVTMLTGFLEISPEKIVLMRSLGASKLQILRMVILPGSLPTIMSALKLNIGMSWVGVIVGEFLVSRAGLGYLTVYGGQVFKLDLVMSATAILCVLAAVMYKGVAALESWVRRKRGMEHT